MPRHTASAALESLLGIPADDWPTAAPSQPLWERVTWAIGTAPVDALRASLAARGAQAEMARRLGCTPMQMSAMCAGRRAPTIAEARAIDREIGIPWVTWFSSEETRAAREREVWRVAGDAGRALLAWADDWDRWRPVVPSWVRLGMAEERMRDVVAGVMPADAERASAARVAGVPAEAWDG